MLRPLCRMYLWVIGLMLAGAAIVLPVAYVCALVHAHYGEAYGMLTLFGLIALVMPPILLALERRKIG